MAEKIPSEDKMCESSLQSKGFDQRDLETHDIFLNEHKPKMKTAKSDASAKDIEKNALLLQDRDTPEMNIFKDPSMMEKGDETPKLEVDGKYGWIVVIASFCCCFIVGVMFIAFSILYLEFVDYFEAERGVAGWIGSLYLATGNVCGVVMGLVIERKGCRFLIICGSLIWSAAFAASAFANHIPHLYITYGVFGGIGFNTVTLSSFVIVQKHFNRHRSLAAGLSAAGISIGSLTSGPLIGFFVSTFGWRGALLLMSGMALNCCVFGTFYRMPRTVRTVTFVEDGSVKSKTEVVPNKTKKQESNGSRPKNQVVALLKGLVDVSLFHNPRFVVACLSTFFFNFGVSVFYQHTPSRAVSYGIERQSAYLIQTIIGVATLTARIFGAWIGNAKCTDRILQYGFSVMAGGVCLLSTGLTRVYETICLVAACTGFTSGLIMTIQTTVLADIVGVGLVHRAQALLLVFMGLGALIGVPLAGVIYDRTRNYNLPFYIGGSLELFGGILFVVTHLFLKFRANKNSSSKVPIN